MKKLVVLFLGIFLVVSLAGCGGGGGKKEEVGATMTKDQLNSRYDEASTAADTVETVFEVLESLAEEPSANIAAKSQILKAEEGDELSWSASPNAEGWYTATFAEDDYSVTVKMRYLASTGTIQLEESWVDGSVNGKKTMNISKGTNGLSNGYGTDINSDENQLVKIEFTNLDATNGCGEYICWINDKKRGNITITKANNLYYVNGSLYDENGNEIKKFENQQVTY
jgi:hypothetical protein